MGKKTLWTVCLSPTHQSLLSLSLFYGRSFLIICAAMSARRGEERERDRRVVRTKKKKEKNSKGKEERKR
jgi:hypothetical protein